VIIKKLCKQKVIGLRMHQSKVSGLNSVQLICDSYFNFWFNIIKQESLVAYLLVISIID